MNFPTLAERPVGGGATPALAGAPRRQRVVGARVRVGAAVVPRQLALVRQRRSGAGNEPTGFGELARALLTSVQHSVL